jgi:DNA-binding IclR family transcriptional regulator
VQSADKALAILAAFTEARPELGASELAGELGIHKSTVSRLLATLERRGLVRRVGDRFLPGPELARLGSLAARGLSLLPTARDPFGKAIAS